jgi:hypothetical protein
MQAARSSWPKSARWSREGKEAMSDEERRARHQRLISVATAILHELVGCAAGIVRLRDEGQMYWNLAPDSPEAIRLGGQYFARIDDEVGSLAELCVAYRAARDVANKFGDEVQPS